jgi:hypothetical protein
MFGITSFAQSPFAALGVSVFNEAQVESIAAADAVAAVVINTSAIAESMGAADLQRIPGLPEPVFEEVLPVDAYSVSNNIFNVVVSESTTPSDTDSSTGLILTEEMDETVGIADSISFTASLAADIAESITPDDVVTGERQFNLFISESVSAADTQAGVFNFVTTVAETVAALDNMTFTVDARALPTGILITISVTNVNVWGNIDDDSNPNWVIIND